MGRVDEAAAIGYHYLVVVVLYGDAELAEQVVVAQLARAEGVVGAVG